MLPRSLLLISLLSGPAWADLAPGPPPAQRILVITGGAPVAGALTVLQNTDWQTCGAISGGTPDTPEMDLHSVATAGSIPASATLCANYDQVWDLRFDQAGCTADPCSASLTAADQNNLRAFMGCGGSVYLMGDNGGFPGRNNGIVSFVQSVELAGSWGSGGFDPGTAGVLDLNAAGALSAENFAGDYRGLSDTARAGSTAGQIWMEYPGGLIGPLGSGRSLYTNPGSSNRTVVTAWTQADLQAPYSAGKLMVTTDWQVHRDSNTQCGPSYANSLFIENALDFLVVESPSTPTSTRSATPVAASTTPSATRSATPSASPSATPSASPSPTASPTPSATPSFSPSHTPSASPSASPSSTATPTATDSPQFTPTATPSGTPSRSASPSSTATPSDSPSATDTATRTGTLTPSDTPTQSPTPSPSATPSDTRSATPSGTPSLTFSASPTPSASSTQTLSSTPSPTFSASPTHSQTPLAVPFHVVLRVYNAAGESVRLLYDGGMDLLPQGMALGSGAFAPGEGRVDIRLGGLFGGGLDHLSWEGGNDAGQAVAAGTYYIKADIQDPFGRVSSFTQAVQVVPAAARRSLSIYNASGELVYQAALAWDLHGMAPAEGAIAFEYDAAGAALRRLRIDFRDAAGALKSLWWDGRNQLGLPVESGTYTLQLLHSLPGSQAVVEMRKVAVLRPAQSAPFADARLSPNPARNQPAVEVFYAPQPGGVSARLISLAGERVAAASDPAGAGRLRLDIAPLAPGIYFLELSAGRQRRILKLAVLK